MFDSSMYSVLDALHEMRPLPIEESESRLEKLCKKPAKFLLWSAIISFIALGLLAACVWIFDLSAENWINLALALYVGSTGAAVAWMFIDTIPALVTIFVFKRDLHRTRKLEIAHDLQHANDLRRFEAHLLAVVDKWLSIRIERFRLRLGIFLGGADKVAVVAILLGGWGIWKNFPTTGATWEQYGYLLFSGFVGGIGLGGMLVNVVIKELSYQRDLLALALGMPIRDP